MKTGYHHKLGLALLFVCGCSSQRTTETTTETNRAVEPLDPDTVAIQRFQALRNDFGAIRTRLFAVIDQAERLADQRTAAALIEELVKVVCEEAIGLTAEKSIEEVEEHLVRRLSPASLAHVRGLNILGNLCSIVISIVTIQREIADATARFEEGKILLEQIRVVLTVDLPINAEERAQTLLDSWEIQERKKITDKDRQLDAKQEETLEKLKKDMPK